MGYEQWVKQQDELEEKKRRNALGALKKIQDQAQKAEVAENWLRRKGLDPDEVDGEQFLELLYEDDREEKGNS